jgi:LDH2 family malate/lactate/ureidoglycolate dehydrogenase
MTKDEAQLTTIPCEILEQFMSAALQKIGAPEKDAQICAAVTISASKRGIDSHGVERFKAFYYDRVRAGIQNAKTEIEIVRETPTTAVVDGHNGMGQVIATTSMNLAVKKAKKYGLGMVAVRNSTHYGIAAHYTELAIKHDLIGITGTNTRPAVAPTYGVENMLGTNPIAIGMPTDEVFPLIFDSATSLAQRGKIEKYARMNEQLPSGWVINNQGETVTDPQIALQGLTQGTCALTPIGGIGTMYGGHKGYGFSLMVEVLSAALQQGAFLKALSGMHEGKAVPFRIGHFFLAIDINAFVEPAAFKKTTGDILRTLRISKKIPGQKRIYTPFEIEYETEQTRSKTGIPIAPSTLQGLLQIQKEQGLTQFELLS